MLLGIKIIFYGPSTPGNAKKWTLRKTKSGRTDAAAFRVNQREFADRP